MQNNKKTWLIFGASSGIGKEATIQLLRKGCNVIAVSRSLLDYKHENLLCLSADVTQLGAINAAIKQGIARFGGIDVLLNSAGISTYGTFEEETVEDMRNVMEINFWGAYNTMKLILPYFRENGKGVIINISSEMGLYPRAYGAAYCSSKYALEGLSSVVGWEAKSFCKVITVELDKFNGTKIGANKPKGVSNIKEYQRMQWLMTPDINYGVGENDLKVAVKYIIEESEKKNPTRRLLLGKTICFRANEEIKSIKENIKYSLKKAYNCAHFDIAKLAKNSFRLGILKKLVFGKKKEHYTKKYRLAKYMNDNFGL